jgi:hypothetical protein
VGIKGDIEELFAATPCPPSVMRALSSVASAVQQKLTFERELAKLEAIDERSRQAEAELRPTGVGCP